MSRRFSVILTTALAATTACVASVDLVACSQSCLDEYPCNVPADEPDAHHDAASVDANQEERSDANARDAADLGADAFDGDDGTGEIDARVDAADD